MYLCSIVVGTRPVSSLRNVAQAFLTALMAGGVATRGKSSPGMRCEISPTLSTMTLLLRDRVQRGFFCPHSTVLLILKMPVSKYTMSAPSSRVPSIGQVTEQTFGGRHQAYSVALSGASTYPASFRQVRLSKLVRTPDESWFGPKRYQ